jgi:hypothetical protein
MKLSRRRQNALKKPAGPVKVWPQIGEPPPGLTDGYRLAADRTQ